MYQLVYSGAGPTVKVLWEGDSGLKAMQHFFQEVVIRDMEMTCRIVGAEDCKAVSYNGMFGLEVIRICNE